MTLNTEGKEKDTESPTSEPTKQPTSNTSEKSEPTEKQDDEKRDVKEPVEKKSVVPLVEIPTKTPDGISDAMEKEIEKAEAEIQKVQYVDVCVFQSVVTI